MDGSGRKIRRRHRADLAGFTITARSMDGPPAADEVYEALADAFWDWYRRKRAAAQAREKEKCQPREYLS